MDDLLVRPLAPPPKTHTSDRPIFKNSFDSENSGKFMRYYICSHIFNFCLLRPLKLLPHFLGINSPKS